MFTNEYLVVSNTIETETNKIGLYNWKSQNGCQKLNQKKNQSFVIEILIKQKNQHHLGIEDTN